MIEEMFTLGVNISSLKYQILDPGLFFSWFGFIVLFAGGQLD